MDKVGALSADNITAVGIVVIAVLVVLGVVISLVISAIVGRVIVAAVVVVLAIVVWQQRGHVKDNVNKRACDLHATFFGVHVDPSTDVKQYCANQVRK